VKDLLPLMLLEEKVSQSLRRSSKEYKAEVSRIVKLFTKSGRDNQPLSKSQPPERKKLPMSNLK